MEYVKIENHKITQIISTNTPPSGEGWQEFCLECGLHIGDDIRMLSADGKMRPLDELVAEGYIKLATARAKDLWPEGTVLEKVQDNQIVKKTLYDFAIEGVYNMMPLEYLDHETKSIKSGSIEELLKLGKITQAKAVELNTVEVRAKRDQLLNRLDTIVSNPLRWGSLDTAEHQALIEYRQALLDVPQQSGFPSNVKWPKKPKVIK